MTHDSGSGTLYLDEKDELRISWPGAGEERYLASVNEKLQKSTEQLHGTFVPNPLWSKFESHALMTAHPLGGSVMADDCRTRRGQP